MMNEHITILKNPNYRESEDYVALRKKGIELIEKLGSSHWTDYNIHDPGITLLELLCFAQTEVGFKLGFSIEDLLAYPVNQAVNWDEQCFFTARKILTVNPFTNNDWRKLLIDQVGIANAWMSCTPCGCHPKFYVDCRESTLIYKETEHPVRIKGFWDALLELQVDSQYGDLNAGKIFYQFTFDSGNQWATAEIRFVPWHKISQEASLTNIIAADSVDSVELIGYHLDVADEVFYKALRDPFRIDVSYKVTTSDGVETVNLVELPVRIWFRSDQGRGLIASDDIKKVFEDVLETGPFRQYLYQLKKAREAVARAKTALQAHRNLAEDYCHISTVPTMDVGICANVEMTADADIEKVLGEAYYQITEYLNPMVRFYTLSELVSGGVYSEQIFNGPKLEHGFILDDELNRSSLRSTLYTSDIINIMMDIEGIVAVKNIVLTRYDEWGKLVESQPWELKVTPGHQPRLYLYASKVLVFKDGLPFLPNQQELHDTLQMWRGIRQQNKVIRQENDFPVPTGEYLNGHDHYPMQYSLPETYGVGPHGLKEPSSLQRKAQAGQLKAYMLIFEHLLSVYLRQLQHFKDIMSTNPAVVKTYFASLITESELPGVSGFYSDIDDTGFHGLLEDRIQFLERRNGFLDHLLARFAESFSDYALMLYQAYGSKVKAQEELIFDKLNFLEQFPLVSANRARAINYKDVTRVCDPANVSGLNERIKVILGLNGARSFISYQVNKIEGKWEGRWLLNHENGELLLQGPKLEEVKQEHILREQLKQAADMALEQLAANNPLQVKEENSKFKVILEISAVSIAESPETFNQQADADLRRDLIAGFIAQIYQGEKIFVVEHILLRPRNSPSLTIPEGDPFLDICVEKDCKFCGQEDPYSFRITIVLNGEYGVANGGMAFRRFAEKTIRLETPAHLGVKICWVSQEQLTEFEAAYCKWLAELAKESPDNLTLHQRLSQLLEIFKNLKSVYPAATLHDCIDGDDENRVFLNHTII